MEHFVYNKYLMATKWNYLYFTHSATLLAFLVELLKSSVAMQEQMLGGKGFLVIGYLLEKVSDTYVLMAFVCSFCHWNSWQSPIIFP